MPPDGFLRQPEFQAKPAHLVLEQVLQRLDQLEAELLGQAADVVVRLDGRGRAVGGGAALDDVGIERTLSQKVGALDPKSLVLEHVDEYVADDPPFLLRIGDPGQGAEEAVTGVHDAGDKLGVLSM